MKTYYLRKHCLLLVCLGSSFTTLATEYTPDELVSSMEKINHAIIKFEKTERALWSYAVSRYENEEGDITSSIEHYSPHLSTPWLLKKMNGEQPTEKQINDFSEKKQKQASTKKQGSNVQLKLRQLINQESLSLVSTDDDSIVMAFTVNLQKLGEDSKGKLQGQLTYQKDEQFINKISIWNNADFSPMFTAKITDLVITFTFVELNGSILTKKNEMKMEGSFAYFTEINETSLDVFSDYQYQGKQ